MLESEPWLYELVPKKTHSIFISCMYPIHTIHSCIFAYLSAMDGIEESVLLVLNNHVGFQVANLEGHSGTVGAKNELRHSLVVRHSESACVSHSGATNWKFCQKWAYLSCC